MSKNWVVQRIDPRDLYESRTLTVAEWKQRETQSLGTTDRELQDEVEEAISFLGAHPKWTGKIRGEPRVGYDIESDDYYFFFKADDKGYIFVVSDGGIVDRSFEV
jgi:hypothetical protein